MIVSTLWIAILSEQTRYESADAWYEVKVAFQLGGEFLQAVDLLSLGVELQAFFNGCQFAPWLFYTWDWWHVRSCVRMICWSMVLIVILR